MNWTEHALQRFSRHLLLPEVGVRGQERLCASVVTLPQRPCSTRGLISLLHLAGAGVGEIRAPGGLPVEMTEAIHALDPAVKIRDSDPACQHGSVEPQSAANEPSRGADSAYAEGALDALSLVTKLLDLPMSGLDTGIVDRMIPKDPFGRAWPAQNPHPSNATTPVEPAS